ncbi:hypothetical protein C1A50_0272 [Paenibacillus polymyxa]|nr:hypothetical protein C1A50_0272 [Paenibacillus polymyxa]
MTEHLLSVEQLEVSFFTRGGRIRPFEGLAFILMLEKR